MRTALRCSARLSVASHTILRSPTWIRAPYQSPLQKACHNKQWTRQASTEFKTQVRQNYRIGKQLRVADVNDPKAFAALHDELLPAELRFGNGTFPELLQFDLKKLMSIREYGTRKGKVDIWVWMARNGYRRQLIALINRGLNTIASSRNSSEQPPLSNIQWPATIFDDLHYIEKPLSEMTVSRSENLSLDTLTNPRRFKAISLEKDFMSSVWSTLAQLVLASAEPRSDPDESSMRTVLLVLATMHSLDMIPKDVYTYKPSSLSSTVKRPPILHLFSSRILTSLSDATWREQQDEAIAQATQLGHSLKHISENVPGGRFRLKVQPLPTELWLELILWCCVDHGLKTTAYQIINTIHHSEEPWFAVRWCSTQTSPLAETLVDWNRVKLRHGGVVGRIEGYSREKPFADVPEKTISAEVVLALIENLAAGTGTSSSFAMISDLLHFLEPHDLPPSYFDYLQSRLLFADFYNGSRLGSEAKERSQQFTSLNSLKPIKDVPRAIQTLELDSILDHSLLHVGIMQQSLDALVSCSAVHDALELFNSIQEQVDHNKFRSIEEFSQRETYPYRMEYADSHGQIPNFRLASFLDLATEAGMPGLGEWLLYSEDLDDAIISPTSFSAISLAPSLIRYASANKDDALLARIHATFDAAYIASRRRPSVRIYRAFFNAAVENLDLSEAVRYLFALKDIGARIGLSNYAHLASVILRTERGDLFHREDLHHKAVDLMDTMLSGRFYSSAKSETLIQKMQYEQQLSHVLRVFAQCEHSSLSNLAAKYAPKYARGNNVMLYIRTFNVLLDAVAKAYGAARGRKMYKIFCRTSNATFEQFESDTEDGPKVEENIELQSNDYEELDTAEDFADSFFPTNHHDTTAETVDTNVSSRFLRPIPITIPQASTIRVILRAAFAQEGVNQEEFRHWAVSSFLKLGEKSRNTISHEVRKSLTDADIHNMSLIRYQPGKDYHTMAEDDRGLYQAQIEYLARQTQEKKQEQRKAAQESLWAELVPRFTD